MTTKQFDAYSDLITFTRASTATYLDSDGLLKSATTNTPRIEYDADGNRLGLLIEEARTNVLLRSEELDVSPWASGNISAVTANSVIAPDGLQSADSVVENTANGSHSFLQNVSYTSGVTYTSTVYAKPLSVGDQRFLQLAFGGAAFTALPFANFDLLAGTITSSGSGNSASSSIENAGGGWYRCRLTATADVTVVSAVFILMQSNASAPRFAGYLGDGVSGLNLWGAQLEAGSFPTSYIPTAGAAATRAADVASIPTSAFGYNADKGSLCVNGTFRNAQTIVTLGSSTIATDVSGLKDYTATYSSDPSATSLVLNGGTYESLKYFPRVLTAAQLQRLTS